MKKNTEYEKLVQKVYQAVIDQEGNKTIMVQHNVKLIGKSGQAHQIDVYWEYEIAGVCLRVVIECKNYSKSLTKGHVTSFHSVLMDLNGVNGIMITKAGYQKGAKKFGDHYGIRLMELRNPTDEDLKGRIKEIIFDFVAVIPKIKSRIPQLDHDWVLKNIPLPKEGEQKFIWHGRTDEILIFDKSGRMITNLYELDVSIPLPDQDAENCEHVFSFEDGYIDINPFGRVKVKGIKYVYDVKILTEDLKISADQLTRLILKDTRSGVIKFFDKQGNFLEGAG